MSDYITLVAVSGNNGVTVARAPGWYNSENDDGVVVEGAESEVQKVVATAYVSPDESAVKVIKALCGGGDDVSFPRILKTIREYPVEYRNEDADIKPF